MAFGNKRGWEKVFVMLARFGSVRIGALASIMQALFASVMFAAMVFVMFAAFDTATNPATTTVSFDNILCSTVAALAAVLFPFVPLVCAEATFFMHSLFFF